MVSDGTNFSEFVPSKADGVRDYNDSCRNIRVGFAGSSLGLGNSDAEQNVKYLAGYTESGKHIKDVNLNAARQYLGINNVDNTADSSKSVNYANSAGTANKCNNVIYSHQNEVNFSGGKQSTCYFNYRNADSDVLDGGTTGITYKFCNYSANTAYSTIEANNFVGKINGNTVSKSVPSDANFSNDKVAQTAVKNTDYSDWRSLVWGASHSSTEGFAPSSVTDNLFSTNTLSVQPSTGTIKANTFKGNLTGKAASAGSADIATTANRVANTGDATANAARHVWFSDSETETARVSNNNFKYNPIGNILTVNVSGNAATASAANRVIEVADYNNTGQGVKIGYAGAGFTASDFQYALGMNNERKIKDVSQGEYRKWLGLGSAAYTSSSNYAANDVVTISSSQPTSSTCKLWIKI